MRELEFLPQWYPRTRRRRRLVILQTWATLALVITLASWLVRAERNVRAATTTLSSIDHALGDSRAELVKLDELLALDNELQRQQQVLNKVGMSVEGSRLLATLDQVMPEAMALLELNYRTMEQPREPARPPGAMVSAKDKDKPIQMDRWLEVTVVGVAPTDVDLANFLAKLTARPFFRSVRVSYAKDRPEAGHLMRQFEVQFSMDLNEPATN